MAAIPVYLKTAPQTPRPQDPVFYWCTRSGYFLCRNFDWYQSDIPATRPPQALAEHSAQCLLSYPKLSATALEYIVGFLSAVYDEHCSEAIVLLLWDLQRQRYKLHVPVQEATVWEASSGMRTPLDVKYELPVDLLGNRYLLIGDIHGHGDHDAQASHTDRNDERYRDGIHAIVGRIEREPPEISVALAVDGFRFAVHGTDLLAGYRRRRQLIPRRWMEQVKVVVRRPTWPIHKSWRQNGSYEA